MIPLPSNRKSRHARANNRVTKGYFANWRGNKSNCGNRRCTVREIPSKRRARVAINLPDRSTVAIPNVSGVARHTGSNSVHVTSRRDNRVEYVRAPWNWKKLINSARARESLNYYRGSELYIFLHVHTHTCVQIHDQVHIVSSVFWASNFRRVFLDESEIKFSFIKILNDR